MKFVKNEITGFISSNVLEDETAWLVGSVFNRGNEIRDGHYIYAYLGVNGTNSTTIPSLSPLLWLVQRPTNYWAAIDGVTNSQTKRTDNITWEVAVNNYDTVSLLEVEAKTIIMTLTVASVIVYTKTYLLQDESGVIDFYSYCYSDFVFKNSSYTQDLPLYLNGILKIEIINATGTTAKCGRLIAGRSFYVGKTTYDASLGIEAYTTTQIDQFGTEVRIHKGAVNLDSYEVKIPTSKIPILKRKFADLSATPLLFVFDESVTSNTEHLLTFGYYQNMNMMVPNATSSVISITVKGIL